MINPHIIRDTDRHIESSGCISKSNSDSDKAFVQVDHYKLNSGNTVFVVLINYKACLSKFSPRFSCTFFLLTIVFTSCIMYRYYLNFLGTPDNLPLAHCNLYKNINATPGIRYQDLISSKCNQVSIQVKTTRPN